MNIDDLKYGEYCGMNAIYTPTIEVSQKKIAKFFSKFDFLQVAKAICELAINLLDQNTDLYISTPYSNDTLCKAFNLAIRFAGNSIQVKDKAPSKKELETILLIAAGEIDKNFKLMASVTNQFSENYSNQIARIWCIFHELWPQLYNESPLQKIEEMVHVPYIMILGFSWSIINSGYTLVCKEYKEIEEKLGIKLEEKWCENYLDYFSCSRNQWLSNSCPPTYISKPILDSGYTPSGKDSRLYFIPSAKNLISRVTTGLLYDLANQHNIKAGHGNTFKSQFGKAFEQYVLKLFRYHLDESFIVSGEIEYGSKKKQKKTTDLLIRQGDYLLLIEVKQASLYANALYNGKEDDIKDDLKRNLGNAVKELSTTEQALDESYSELQEFIGCDKIFKLIVFNTPLYFANNFCKDLLEDIVDLSDISIINISELEMLLDVGQSTQNLFEMLELKNKDFSNYSFKDFIARAYPESEQTGAFIHKYLDEVFATIKPALSTKKFS